MIKGRIMLDPGHCGPNYNAGVVAGYYESATMWKLTMYEKEYLESLGYEVGLTRNNINENPELTYRGQKAEGYDLFVSNHTNACGTKTVTKAEVIYLVNNSSTNIDDKSKIFATNLADVIKNVMPITESKIYSKKSGNDRDKNGVLDDNYYGVLHGTYLAGTPGVIAEHSYHTNPDICKWLMNDDNLRNLAKACASCMADFVRAHGKKNTSGSSTSSVPKNDKTSSSYPKVPFKVEVIVDDLNYRNNPSMNGKILGQTRKGTFTIIEVSNGWGLLKSKVGWIWLGNAAYCRIKETIKEPSFIVRVDINDLNIRTGPGTNYKKTGKKTGKGIFTIIEVKEGSGSDSGWGKLHSGVGWISLDYAKRV